MVSRISIATPLALRRQGGYTLLEILFVVALVGLLAALGLGVATSWIPRLAIRSKTQEVSMLVGRARMEAVRAGVRTVVELDPDARRIHAYADVNGDPIFATPGYPSYLVYDPDPVQPDRRTDYRIGLTPLEQTLAAGPTRVENGADSVVGLTTSPNLPPGAFPVLVFEPSGVVRDPGSFRLADARIANLFELAAADLTGEVELRKYLDDDDSPTGTAGYFTEGRDSGGRSLWVWY